MGSTFHKKCWPNLFEKMLAGKKTADLRLADFKLREGDTLVLEEYSPVSNEYTGRTLSLAVKNLTKVQPLDFHTTEEVLEHAHWLIELEEPSSSWPSYEEWIQKEEPQYWEDLTLAEEFSLKQIYKLKKLLAEGTVRAGVGDLLTDLKQTAERSSVQHSVVGLGPYLSTYVIPRIEKALGMVRP